MKRNTTQRDKDRATLARTRGACHICGKAIDYTLPWLDPGAFTVDHIVPLARGGADNISNKAPAHRACNRAKGDKPYAANILRRSGALG